MPWSPRTRGNRPAPAPPPRDYARVGYAAEGGGAMGVIDRYHDRLPVGADTPNVSLGEGGLTLRRPEPVSSGSSARARIRPVRSAIAGWRLRLRRRRGRRAGDHVRVDRQHGRVGGGDMPRAREIWAVVPTPAGAIVPRRSRRRCAPRACVLEVRALFLTQARPLISSLVARGDFGACAISLNP